MAHIKNSTLVEIHSALSRLDGFKFSGTTSYAIAKNLRLSKNMVDRIESLRCDLVTRVSNGSGIIQPETLEMVEFQAGFKALMEDTSEVNFHKITLSGLNLDENSTLSPSIIANLEEIIEEDVQP